MRKSVHLVGLPHVYSRWFSSTYFAIHSLLGIQTFYSY